MNEQNAKDNKKKKREIALIFVLLAASCLLFFLLSFINKKPPALAVVTVDGKTVATLDLQEDTDMTIDGYGGGTNRLVIRDGVASITEATCPDKVCVRTGKVYKTGGTIVCLPNRVVVVIEGGDEE